MVCLIVFRESLQFQSNPGLNSGGGRCSDSDGSSSNNNNNLSSIQPWMMAAVQSSTAFSDEVRDMPPSSYSITDIREREASSYDLMDENGKAAQMKPKLAHRLIDRFKNDYTVRDNVTP